MCLGVPGKVIAIEPNPLGMTMGKVNFAGVTKNVCLAYVPGIEIGDYVVVHVGFALRIVDRGQHPRARSGGASRTKLNYRRAASTAPRNQPRIA